MRSTRRKMAVRGASALLAALLSLSAAVTGRASETAPAAEGTIEAGAAPDAAGKESIDTKGAVPDLQPDGQDFLVDRFVLPEGARVLVVVEGTGGSACQVYAYERPEAGDETWILRLCTAGRLGRGGMSNHRTEGDLTTPIGVFQMDTPFGQGKPLEGFPENYIQVTKSYVWVTKTNRLEASSTEDGERVGTKGYAGYYEYVLNAGYNKNAVEKKGSALFLHCQRKKRTGSAGCVEIPKEDMIAIMRLYGAYGDGACYIAQAPRGTFPLIYDSYGANNGLSPEGDFTIPMQ